MSKEFTCVDRSEDHPCKDIYEFLFVEELEELETQRQKWKPLWKT